MQVEKKWNEQKVFAAMLALIAWTTVVMQFFFSEGTAANFFSFFTIQCNMLVAISCTCAAFFTGTAVGRFFTGLSTQTAIALYIFIVALVYNTVLRGLVPLSGWNLFLDTMLHVVIPILYLLYWSLMRPKGNLEYRNGLYWVIFPMAYLIYSLIRGSIVHWYPYPFLNADKSGYTQVSINVAVMIVVFFIAGLILIAITRKLRNKEAMMSNE